MKTAKEWAEHHEYWYQQWGSALVNMPRRKKGQTDGKFGALARCLGLPLYSPSTYSAHNRVYQNWRRGSKPKNPKVTNRLQRYAGPHGKLLAWMCLTRLGIAHRYVKPEQF